MTVLRENARISKEKLNKLIRGLKGGLYVEETKTVHSCCASCPYQDKLNLYNEYCEQYCDEKEIIREIKKINTIKKRKQVQVENSGETIRTLEMEYVVKDYKFIQPSKTVIKQYIFYHFLVSNEYRVRRNITSKLIAEELGISVTTVRRNNKLLQDLGLVHIRKITASSFDIFIFEEDKLHLKKSEGGTGYLPLPKYLYENIKAIKDVNVLRVELKKILKADADKNIKKAESPNISQIRVNSITEILPYYLRRAKKKLNEKVFSEQSLFKLKKQDENKEVYQMNISNYKTSEVFTQEFMKTTKASLVEFVENNNIAVIPDNLTLFELTEEDTLSVEQEAFRKSLYAERIADLAQLSMEYGVQTIRDMLIYVKHRYVEGENIVITSIGAFVRNIIKYFISLEGSNFKISI